MNKGKGKSFDRLRRDLVDALITAEQTGHLESLVELARSEAPPRMAGDWVAELCPTATKAELGVLYATLEYKDRGLKAGESKKAAIARLALKYNCNKQQLTNCVNGAGQGLLAYRKRLVVYGVK
jgi:hypothetical protein